MDDTYFVGFIKYTDTKNPKWIASVFFVGIAVINGWMSIGASGCQTIGIVSIFSVTKTRCTGNSTLVFWIGVF